MRLTRILSVRVRQIAWIGVALLAGTSTGCKSMAEHQRKHYEGVEKAQEQAKVAENQNQSELTKLDEREKEIKRQQRRIEIRRERIDAMREAQDSLGSRDYARVIEICDAVFASAEPRPEHTPKTTPEAKAASTVTESSTTNEVKPDAEPDPVVELEAVDRAQWLVLRGAALHGLERTDDAIAAFEKAAELDDTNRNARVNLGKLLYSKERYADALVYWQRELAAGFRSGELLFLVAKAHYQLSLNGDRFRLDIARNAVADALVEQPQNKSLQHWLALLEFEGGRYEEALRLLEILSESNPNNREFARLIADCHLLLEDRASAIDAYESYARLFEESPQIQRTLGDLYASAGLPERAAYWYRRRYGETPSAAPAEARLDIGLLLADAGQLDTALVWLKAIDESDPGYADARTRCGQIYRDRGDSGLALAEFEKLRAKRANDGALHLMLGDLYMDAKRLDDAGLAYGVASSLPGFEAEGLAGLAETAYASSKLEEAIRYYRQAVAKAPGQRRYEINLQQLLQEKRLAARK